MPPHTPAGLLNYAGRLKLGGGWNSGFVRRDLHILGNGNPPTSNFETHTLREFSLDLFQKFPQLDFRVNLEAKTSRNPLGIGTDTLLKTQCVGSSFPAELVGMKLHRVAATYTLDVIECEFAPHVIEQAVLQHEDQTLTQVLEGGNFVVQLDQNCFRGHFPVHAESLGRFHILFLRRYAVLFRKSLSFWPDRACRVHCLQLDTYKIPWPAIANRHQAVINTAAGNGKLSNDS